MQTAPIADPKVPTEKSVVFNGTVVVSIVGAMFAAFVGAVPMVADSLPKGTVALIWIGTQVITAGYGAWQAAQNNTLRKQLAAAQSGQSDV